jgi:ABC-type bacteriocin/lantibiotic exporter with double-glycine peptidase domain
MSIKLPLYAQEKRNTCALACLGMVLAAFGTEVAEGTLEEEARMEEGGTPIEELERLANQFHLIAEIQETTTEELKAILAAGNLPIAYIDRAAFASKRRKKYIPRHPVIHTVIPIRISENFVSFHDPLSSRIARRTIHSFQIAHKILGNRCVVRRPAK